METPLRTGQKVQVRGDRDFFTFFPAILSDAASIPGTQFMHKPRDDTRDETAPRARTLSFSTLPTEDAVRLPASTSGETKVVEGISVGTEGGFFYSPGQKGQTARTLGSVCKVVGASGWMKV
jgi:hypothetical protein